MKPAPTNKHFGNQNALPFSPLRDRKVSDKNMTHPLLFQKFSKTAIFQTIKDSLPIITLSLKGGTHLGRSQTDKSKPSMFVPEAHFREILWSRVRSQKTIIHLNSSCDRHAFNL